ncbi:MAG: hypothetical protein HUJ51_01025 [Eggerthellaceae bacterium]|nr:hypothetical protein [Eggerthellaceae bacterium]
MGLYVQRVMGFIIVSKVEHHIAAGVHATHVDFDCMAITGNVEDDFVDTDVMLVTFFIATSLHCSRRLRRMETT